VKKTFLSLLALIIFSSIQPGYAKATRSDLPNFDQVNAVLYRGGQPSDKGLEELKAMGIKTVISLRHNKFEVERERRKAKELGLAFDYIPMDGLHKPSKAKINQFLSIVTNPACQPVFVHCEFGQDRTGTMVAIYREEVQNWSAKHAYDEMVSKGFEKRYAWLADSVFDYEEDKFGARTSDRPANAKMLDSVEQAIGTRPNYKDRIE